jgi:threonine aldolase
VEGRRGVYGPDDVRDLLDPDALHAPQVRLFEIENSHNRVGGTVWTPAQTKLLGRFAREHGVPVHLDGARVFNAAIAQGVAVTELTRDVDSVMFCLSKGLSAPVGSMLCGSQDFIDRARIVRKILGGGMRQAGVLAAAGLVALDQMVDRLGKDHENARRLASGLSKIEGLRVDLDSVQTNIVMVDVGESGFTEVEFCAALAKHGVKAAPRDVGTVVRFVTHRHVERAHIDATLDAVATIMKRSNRPRGRHERSKTSIRSTSR